MWWAVVIQTVNTYPYGAPNLSSLMKGHMFNLICRGFTSFYFTFVILKWTSMFMFDFLLSDNTIFLRAVTWLFLCQYSASFTIRNVMVFSQLWKFQL